MRLGREAGAMWSRETWPSTRLLAEMLAFDPIMGFSPGTAVPNPIYECGLLVTMQRPIVNYVTSHGY